LTKSKSNISIKLRPFGVVVKEGAETFKAIDLVGRIGKNPV
jgi:hypothetical protein